MLGKYSNGMMVRIPATFQDSNQRPVEMDNVNVRIQFYDNSHRDLKNILEETPMKHLGIGRYAYEFQVPPTALPGNYIVHIQAKYPGSISNVTEATDTFEVIESRATVLNQVKTEQPTQSVTEAAIDNPKPDFDINTFKIDQVKRTNQYSRIEIEDIVVDVFNNPVKGVHVNVFEKAGFSPKSPNNLKIASTITDETGTWKMVVSPGEYVFTYKGLGLKEMREFRKV